MHWEEHSITAVYSGQKLTTSIESGENKRQTQTEEHSTK